MFNFNNIGTIIIGLIAFTWVLLILIGLGYITDKVFKANTITTQCPNVDINDIHTLDGVQLVKLNYPTIIETQVYNNTIDLSNKPQRDIIKISLVSIWLMLGLIIPLILVYKK